jgi:small membrane protein
MIIRILLIVGLAATGWLIFLRRNRLPIHIMTVFALLVAGGVAVVFPEMTQQVAELVGVGRGTDLVTYIAIVVVMFVLLHYYTKFVELQRQVTELTREIAILRTEVDRVAPPASERRNEGLDQDAARRVASDDRV